MSYSFTVKNITDKVKEILPEQYSGDVPVFLITFPIVPDLRETIEDLSLVLKGTSAKWIIEPENNHRDLRATILVAHGFHDPSPTPTPKILSE